MKAYPGWAVAGAVLGLVLGAVLFAPAVWLARGVAAASSGQVQLADARGSVWRGNAQLVFAGGAGSSDALALPGRLEWLIDPLAQGLRLRLFADCCTQLPLDIRLVPGWSGLAVHLADGNSQWPAALLAGLGAPWNTVQPQGALSLSTQGLSVEWFAGRFRMNGMAQVEALGMSSRLSTLRPLGSYRLQMVGNAGQQSALVQLQTLEGSLELTGAGQWNGARWSFRGEASAASESEPALGNLLNLLGRRQGPKSLISFG